MTDIEDTTTEAIASEIGKRFVLWRTEDHSGVSGTGVVATGVRFPTGQIALAWFGEDSSVAIWASVENMMNVHGHNGATTMHWVD